MSVICTIKCKWTCEVVTFTGRASALGAWAETPFTRSITIESVILGLRGKGINGKKEPDFDTLHKITQANSVMGLVTSANEKDLFKRECMQFNVDESRERVINETIIGDMCGWAAARGSGFRKTCSNLDRIKSRIELCRGMTIFSCRQRNV